MSGGSERERLARILDERRSMFGPMDGEAWLLEVLTAHVAEERARLVAALTPFLPGGDWGRTKAWMVNGAPTKEEGIALARRLTEIQANLERALLADPAAATPDATGGGA